MNIIVKKPATSASLMTESSLRWPTRVHAEQLLMRLTAPLLFSVAFLVAGAPNAPINDLWPGRSCVRRLRR